MDVVIDKSGRMILPKETMERYGLDSNPGSLYGRT